jgi:transcriptional regulator with XRE-family HTH domain
MMTPQTLGWKLSRARRRAGLSQADIARTMGTTQSAISRLEAGRVTPTVEMVTRYAQAIGSPITLTFGGTEPADRSIRARRARAALDGFRFDPWDREPSAEEARTLRADGMSDG